MFDTNVEDFKCEEAGLVMQWVGKQMHDFDLLAAAALDFDTVPQNKSKLADYLVKQGVDVERAEEIADDVTLEDLTSMYLDV